MRAALATVALASWMSLFLAAGQTAAMAQGGNCNEPYPTGYKVVSIPNGPKAAVWYPTDTPGRPFAYTPDISGIVAADAEPSKCRRFPLVVFSHGLGGCGTQSIFFTEQLARQGYVVVAPDHRDATCRVDGSGKLGIRTSQQSFLRAQDWTPETHDDRRRDIVRVLDWILGSQFGPTIDAGKIGGIGHSIGGYTLIGMAGAWPSWRDRRLKALLLFSPYIAPFLIDDRLRQVDIPVMYQGAGFDLGITPTLRGKKGAFAAMRGNSSYVELKGGSHFEWTNAVCLGVKQIDKCLESRRNARLIVEYGATFFDRHLMGESRSLQRLNGAGLTTYERK